MSRIPHGKEAVFLFNRRYFTIRPALSPRAFDLCTEVSEEAAKAKRFYGNAEIFESSSFPSEGKIRLTSHRQSAPGAAHDKAYCLAVTAERRGAAPANGDDEAAGVDVRMPLLLQKSSDYHCLPPPDKHPLTCRGKMTSLMNPIAWRDDQHEGGPDGLIASALFTRPELLGMDGDDQHADGTSRMGESRQGPVLIQPGVVFCRSRDLFLEEEAEAPLHDYCMVLVSHRHLAAKLLCHRPHELGVKDLYSFCWGSKNDKEPCVFAMRHDVYAQLMSTARRLASHIKKHAHPDTELLLDIAGKTGAPKGKLSLCITVHTQQPLCCPHLLFREADLNTLLPKSGTLCNQYISVFDRYNPSAKEHTFFTNRMEEGQAPMFQYQRVLSNMVILDAKKKAQAEGSAAPTTETPENLEKLMCEHYISVRYPSASQSPAPSSTKVVQ